MLRIRYCLMALTLAIFPLGCTPMGCSGEDPEQDESADEQFVDAVEQQLPAPRPGMPSLYGTWSGSKTSGDFDMLVLMTNGRFHSSKTVICYKAPCDPIAHDGAFKLYTRDERSFIELATTDSPPQRYEYALTSGDNLRLRSLIRGSEWFALAHSGIAWCATARECNVQNLPPGVCAGKYECTHNACEWKCAMGGEPSAVPDTGATDAVTTPADTKTP